MEKQWHLHNPDEQCVRRLARDTGCDPLLARLMVIRGITSPDQANRFLCPSLGHLTAPLKMAGMHSAVERIYQALTHREKILVFGDYDADGITATALLVTFLRQCDAVIDYTIPYRLTDGYGLGSDFIQRLIDSDRVDLIITVDCGSGSHEAIDLARQAGIDTIVTDHHPIDELPGMAVAVVNPTRSDCPAAMGHLAGVGVAFYLAVALRAHLREQGFWQRRTEPNLKQLCDLVALGTVADVAPLVHENRTLTAAGLDTINRGDRPGIRELMRQSGAPPKAADAETIAFKLAPRINAAGRMAHARMACELLLTTDSRRARRLAAALGRLNSRRQQMEKELVATILEQLAATDEAALPPVLVVHGNHWHEGILGIVASRLARRFHRPAVVLSTINGVAKGSARSVEGIDVTAALGTCADLLDRFGGHPLAAGLALPSTHLESFSSRLEAAVATLMEQGDAAPFFSIDAHLPIGAVTPKLMRSIERLGPFGQKNPAPLFMDRDVRVLEGKTVGGHHHQMVLESAAGGSRQRAIRFNVGENAPIDDRFEQVAYRPQWNHWNGSRKLQLLIEETLPARSPC